MQMPYGADRRKWYSIDYAAMDKLEQTFASGQNDPMASGQNDPMIGSKCADESSGQNDPINTEIEITSEILGGGVEKEKLEPDLQTWLDKKRKDKPIPAAPATSGTYRERVAAALIAGAARHEHGFDMRWCPPDISERGEQFVLMFGREPRTQSEISHWIKSIREQAKMGIPVDCIKSAFKQMRGSNLTISSPESITKVANDLYSKSLTKNSKDTALAAASEVHGVI
jgi:hypothetical protein